MTEGPFTVLGPLPSNADSNQPNYDSLKRLYCRNGGHHLRMLPGGMVDGSRQENDAYTSLKLKAVSTGVVVIKGQETEQYLAMDKSGKLYSTSLLSDECYFREKLEENHYNTYRSQKYQDHGDWYVAIKRSGKMKKGPNTHKSQNGIYFLPIPVQ